MPDAPGLIDWSEKRGSFTRVYLKLNNYGLMKVLVSAGLIPDSKFNIELAHYEDDSATLEVSLIRFEEDA